MIYNIEKKAKLAIMHQLILNQVIQQLLMKLSILLKRYPHILTKKL